MSNKLSLTPITMPFGKWRRADVAAAWFAYMWQSAVRTEHNL